MAGGGNEVSQVYQNLLGLRVHGVEILRTDGIAF